MMRINNEVEATWNFCSEYDAILLHSITVLGFEKCIVVYVEVNVFMFLCESVFWCAYEYF